MNEKKLRISIIVPTLNEANNLAPTLQTLQAFRRRGCELIVVDGGSHDATATLATPLVDQLIHAKRGRARQMNAGANNSKGDVLWFLHADTLPPATADALICQALQHHKWGRFDVRLSGHQLLLRSIETMMNIRSRITKIATGDQGIFVHRTSFDQIGGYPDIPLMEDIAFCTALRRLGPPACLEQCVQTSSRRWESKGIIRTILLMWWLRFLFFWGIPPSQLVKLYYRDR